jgi:spermidine/putrescine transport system ATP-binding protein
VRIRGEDVTAVPVWRRDIGIVFQSYALFPHMSVMANVVFGLNRRGIRGAEAKRRASEALETVRLTGFDDRRPKHLSGGQQQRVALARAIVTRPKVLLLDEPLSALDRRLRQEMQVELLRIQRESGLTTIFVTHDQEEALTLSDRIAILDKGRIVQQGAPTAIYERPRTRFAASFLGDANFLPGTAAQGAVRIGDAVVRCEGPLPADGTPVTLAVRPERMAMTALANGSQALEVQAGETQAGKIQADGGNAVTGIVSAATYAGAVTTYRLEGPGGLPLRVFVQNRDGTRFAPGSTVRLRWSPADTICLED